MKSIRDMLLESVMAEASAHEDVNYPNLPDIKETIYVEFTENRGGQYVKRTGKLLSHWEQKGYIKIQKGPETWTIDEEIVTRIGSSTKDLKPIKMNAKGRPIFKL